MIEVYWCAFYDVPLCFYLAFCSSLVQWDMNVNLRLHETYCCLESS